MADVALMQLNFRPASAYSLVAKMTVPWTFDHEINHLDEEEAFEVSIAISWD